MNSRSECAQCGCDLDNDGKCLSQSWHLADVEHMDTQLKLTLGESLDEFVRLCHAESVGRGWYSNRNGKPKKRNVGEMIALAHSELSEALEGWRKNLMDDHLPHRHMVMVELGDLFIRIADTAGYLQELGVPDLLGDCIVEKMLYNRTRADHDLKNRNKKGGKKF